MDPQLKKLAEPFQFDDADVIIRTRDLDFPAHKLILSHASSVFKDMFSIPCSPATSQEGIPVIEVTEDAQTMHAILSWVYPNGSNVSESFDDFHSLHRLALGMRKYSMPNLQTIITEKLEAKAVVDPLRVFAIACNAAVPQIARLAATHALKWDFVEIGTSKVLEFNQLRVGTMCKLLRYHNRCGIVASQAVTRYGHFWGLLIRSNHLSQTSTACERWWKDSMKCLQEQSKLRPIQPNYTSAKAVREWCREIKDCSACMRIAALELFEFGEGIEKEVLEAVAQVEPELNDDDYLL